MGEAQIPYLDFSGEDLDLEQESSEAWKALSAKVKEACQTHGYFLLVYDKIPMHLREEMFMAIKALFDLPDETKKKYKRPRHYSGYLSKLPVLPLYESFGIDDATLLDVARDFTNLMWPMNGNPGFCETLNSMSSKMAELRFIIMKMVFESFGIENYYKSYEDNIGSTFRVIKYNAPSSSSNDSEILGLPSHTDKNDLTILCQNEVQGLEVLSKEGNWIKVMVPKGCFIVIVGDALKAWSNGRLHAARHRVMMSGNKERYSCGLFSIPKEGVTIEVPQELVDKEHPRLYRPFTFSDYVSFYASNSGDEALEIYAGV